MALFTDILVYGMVVPIFTPETLGMSTLQVRYAEPRKCAYTFPRRSESFLPVMEQGLLGQLRSLDFSLTGITISVRRGSNKRYH